MIKLLAVFSVLGILSFPALADEPGTSSCGSGNVDSHGDPCISGKTTAGAASKTPFNGGGTARGSGAGGNSGGHGR